MATGRLGKGSAGTASFTAIYTAPNNIQFATVNILVTNTSGADRSYSAAISTASNPSASDYIRFDSPLPAVSTEEQTAVLLSPGESILVKASGTGVVVRAHGIEKI